MVLITNIYFFEAVVILILLYGCTTWTNQTCRTLLEKQGRAHKWCTPMDPRIWSSKSRTTGSNIHTAAMWGYTGCSPEDLPEAMNDWEKGRKRVGDIRACSTTCIIEIIFAMRVYVCVLLRLCWLIVVTIFMLAFVLSFSPKFSCIIRSATEMTNLNNFISLFIC